MKILALVILVAALTACQTEPQIIPVVKINDTETAPVTSDSVSAQGVAPSPTPNPLNDLGDPQ